MATRDSISFDSGLCSGCEGHTAWGFISVRIHAPGRGYPLPIAVSIDPDIQFVCWSGSKPSRSSCKYMMTPLSVVVLEAWLASITSEDKEGMDFFGRRLSVIVEVFNGGDQDVQYRPRRARTKSLNC